MCKVTLLAADLAKDVFQVAGFTRQLKVVFNKQIRRKNLLEFMAKQQPCEVVMEACYSSHHWARCFENMGHTVRLLPAQHVTPFVRGNKSDRNDTVAIAEASRRPNIISVPIKSVARQDIQCLHRMREQCVTRRTALMNQVRGLLSEYGVVAPQGLKAFVRLLAEVTDPQSEAVSAYLKVQFRYMLEEYHQLSERMAEIKKELTLVVEREPQCQLMQSIPGIGAHSKVAVLPSVAIAI